MLEASLKIFLELRPGQGFYEQEILRWDRILNGRHPEDSVVVSFSYEEAAVEL